MNKTSGSLECLNRQFNRQFANSHPPLTEFAETAVKFLDIRIEQVKEKRNRTYKPPDYPLAVLAELPDEFDDFEYKVEWCAEPVQRGKRKGEEKSDKAEKKSVSVKEKATKKKTSKKKPSPPKGKRSKRGGKKG